MLCCCKKNIKVVEIPLEVEVLTEEEQIEEYLLKNNKKIKYNTRSFLSRGGFGQIYMIETDNEKYVEKRSVIKHLKRTLLEAKALIDLKSIYIPDFIRFEKKENFTLLTMEYLSGIDLYEYYEKNGINLNQANLIIVYVIKILKFFLEKGYVHLDVKLENIMYDDKTNKIRLVDFGSVHPAVDELTLVKHNVGTKDYVAPEIFLHHYHSTSDIYSIGCLYWVLVTGTYPYKLDKIREAYFQIKSEFPPPAHKNRFNKLNTDQQLFLVQTLKKDFSKRITYEKLVDLPFINNCINDLNL